MYNKPKNDDCINGKDLRIDSENNNTICSHVKCISSSHFMLTCVLPKNNEFQISIYDNDLQKLLFRKKYQHEIFPILDVGEISFLKNENITPFKITEYVLSVKTNLVILFSKFLTFFYISFKI